MSEPHEIPQSPYLKPPKKKPCNGCPFRKVAPAGWLGGSDVDDYHRLAHSDNDVPCHTQKGYHEPQPARPQDVALRSCAGLAIYRNNSCKYPRVGSGRVACDTVATDPETADCVFKFNGFREHHARGLLRTEPRAKR